MSDEEVIPFIIGEHEPWEATITPATVGAWVDFHSGWMDEKGRYWRPTTAGAERFARKGVARRDAESARSSRSYIIRPSSDTPAP